MSQIVRAVVSPKKREQVEVVDEVIPDPGPGEVVVDVIACGVCHTDLTYREGGIDDDFPFLLGHEAAGKIESVGEGVDMLWRMTHPSNDFRAVADGATLCAGGVELRALRTPGHSPGSMCWYAPDLAALFSGDTLFQGGPGATGRSFSDFPTILASIAGRLAALPDDTVVYTGHGDTTTIGDEIVHHDEWVARGH